MAGASTTIAAGTALVTGASSGIGYELALLCARHGHDLALVARNRLALQSLAERCRQEFGVRVEVFVKDLSAHTAPAELFAELQDQNISIDLLINDAGFAMQGPLVENEPASLVDMLQVNIVALTHLTRLILPGMVKRGRGRILNMASIGSYMPGPLMAAYFASKAYVLSLSEALANELHGTGVTVTALCAGPTDTNFAQRARLTESRAFSGSLLDPAEVARDGFVAMMKGRQVRISGLKLRLQMLPTPLLPRRLLAYFARQYHETRIARETRHDATDWAAADGARPAQS